jgi:hypothetical protein
MNTLPPPENETPQPAELLDLALSQIAEFLKASGKNTLSKLAEKNDGYAQAIWLLEKVSKASLECREQQPVNEQAPISRQGISPETEKQLEQKLEGLG